jgi:hypothetical protein
MDEVHHAGIIDFNHLIVDVEVNSVRLGEVCNTLDSCVEENAVDIGRLLDDTSNTRLKSLGGSSEWNGLTRLQTVGSD